MILLFRIIVITYFLAINFFGFMLIKLQKNNEEKAVPVKDSKILVVGVLGGALGILIAMFILKHRLHSLLLMITMPIFVAITLYLVVMGIITDFNFNLF